MQRNHQRRWLAFWLCFGLALSGLAMVHAALLDLDAFVSFAIFDHNGDPLAPGSIVMIMGSGNSTNDGFQTVGTNLVADSTRGDDVILGYVRIGDNNSSNGTFTATVQYNPDEIAYTYIRFFEFTNTGPITGLVFWGTSAIFELVPTLGVARVDYNPDTNNLLSVQNINNFIIIPEPGTANLFILFFGVLGGIRARMKRDRRAA